MACQGLDASTFPKTTVLPEIPFLSIRGICRSHVVKDWTGRRGTSLRRLTTGGAGAIPDARCLFIEGGRPWGDNLDEVTGESKRGIVLEVTYVLDGD